MFFLTDINSFREVVREAVLILPNKSTDIRYESLTLSLKKNDLTIFSNGGEIVFSKLFEVQGEKDGDIRIQAKWLSEALSVLDDGQATFAAEKEENSESYSLTIKTNNGVYKLGVFESEGEGLEIPDDKARLFTIKPDGLKRITEKTLFAASLDSMRISMTGILLKIDVDRQNKLLAVSTDGHRMVKFYKNVEFGESVRAISIVVPSTALSILQKIFSASSEKDINVFVPEEASNFIFFQGEKTIIKVTLISEKYPNYEAVIPLDNNKRMVIDREMMQKGVKRSEMFSSRGDIRLNVNKGEVEISSESPDRNASSEEKIKSDYEDESFLIGFNGRFLQESLSHIDEKEVLFEFSTSTKAVIIRPQEPLLNKDEDILMVVMPVRINS